MIVADMADRRRRSTSQPSPSQPSPSQSPGAAAGPSSLEADTRRVAEIIPKSVG